jgi:hypothetical protein
VIAICRLGSPSLLTQNFTGFPAADSGAKPLVMMITRINAEPFFAAETFFLAMLGLHRAFLTTASWHSPWIWAGRLGFFQPIANRAFA